MRVRLLCFVAVMFLLYSCGSEDHSITDNTRHAGSCSIAIGVSNVGTTIIDTEGKLCEINIVGSNGILDITETSDVDVLTINGDENVFYIPSDDEFTLVDNGTDNIIEYY